MSHESSYRTCQEPSIDTISIGIDIGGINNSGIVSPVSSCMKIEFKNGVRAVAGRRQRLEFPPYFADDGLNVHLPILPY